MIITKTLESAYLDIANQRPAAHRNSGFVKWQCPSNIALVKYWGKHEKQLPINPSLSLTLSSSVTHTTIEYSYESSPNFSLEFYLNGSSNKPFANRMTRYFKNVSQFLPFVSNTRFIVRSSNNFPSSAGIASSASSYGALALSLCSIEKEVYSLEETKEAFLRKASFLARLGSGSASRSVYGGFVLWGRTPEIEQSGDEEAVPLLSEISPVFQTLRDTILVVNSGAKKVSSSEGHKLMNFHPYTPARIIQARDNISRIIMILKTGNLPGFVELVENEALSLHALMISSNPGVILLKPESLRIIEEIRDFRQESGLPVSFTLDAGPNVHLLYPAFCQDQIHEFIRNKLMPLCENGQVIHDYRGNGPELKS